MADQSSTAVELLGSDDPNARAAAIASLSKLVAATASAPLAKLDCELTSAKSTRACPASTAEYVFRCKVPAGVANTLASLVVALGSKDPEVRRLAQGLLDPQLPAKDLAIVRKLAKRLTCPPRCPPAGAMVESTSCEGEADAKHLQCTVRLTRPCERPTFTQESGAALGGDGELYVFDVDASGTFPTGCPDEGTVTACATVRLITGGALSPDARKKAVFSAKLRVSRAVNAWFSDHETAFKCPDGCVLVWPQNRRAAINPAIKFTPPTTLASGDIRVCGTIEWECKPIVKRRVVFPGDHLPFWPEPQPTPMPPGPDSEETWEDRAAERVLRAVGPAKSRRSVLWVGPWE